MICISISQASRVYTLIDMFNAAPQCDLLEVRLDRFARAPDIAELLATRKKPVIMACRRVEDGGDWQGTEADRLALLRQCVEHKADYVEVELEVADEVQVVAPTKKIIAYTNILEAPEDLAAIYARAVALKPDAIKLAMPARTPEEAWPLVQILGRAAAPTVVLGLGSTGIMLSILARKVGAPWIYASLERGLEADHGLATVNDLEKVYHYREINTDTNFVAVTGFGEVPRVRIALLNAACAEADVPLRCLPLGVGEIPLFKKVLEIIKITHIINDQEYESEIRPLAGAVDGLAKAADSIDWLQLKGGSWQGFNLRCLSVLASLQAATADKSFAGKTFIFAGVNSLAQALASRIQHGGGALIFASSNTELCEEVAGKWRGKAIEPAACPSTPHDFLICCDEKEIFDVKPKAGTTVLDLTARLHTTPFLFQAAELGCKVMGPRRLFLDEICRQAKALTGQDPRPERLAEIYYTLVEE
jgi:3-dehydroquinate dehydratase / shikimate dehydrogenase